MPERRGETVGVERLEQIVASVHLDHLERERPRRRHLPVRTRGRVYFLDIDDIDWLEAADNYVKIHANRETHVIRQTLQRLEASLSPRGFIRVHRSAIVNIARIREIQPWFGGDYIPAINLCVAGNSLGSSVARP